MAAAAIVKLLLVVNLVLVHAGAVIDYLALPHVVRRYAAADSDHEGIERIGRISIALLVGIYTLVALMCHRAGSVPCAAALAAFLLLDMSLSLHACLKRPR